jgi:hypothetical protein
MASSEENLGGRARTFGGEAVEAVSIKYSVKLSSCQRSSSGYSTSVGVQRKVLFEFGFFFFCFKDILYFSMFANRGKFATEREGRGAQMHNLMQQMSREAGSTASRSSALGSWMLLCYSSAVVGRSALSSPTIQHTKSKVHMAGSFANIHLKHHSPF